jgi:hypothetical protein
LYILNNAHSDKTLQKAKEDVIKSAVDAGNTEYEVCVLTTGDESSLTL